MKKKLLIGTLIAAGLYTGTSVMTAGLLGGIGPLGFLRDRALQKHPGNGEKYHPENITPRNQSPLMGKRVLFLGSSVTYGAASLGVSMADYLRKLDGCKVLKRAVSGTTLSTGRANSYVERLLGVKTSYHFDAIVVQLSTNDASKNVDLGEILGPDLTYYDTSTVFGAVEYIIEYCREHWDCPVIFYTNPRYNSDNYQKMVTGLLEIQKQWGIEVLDLWDDPVVNAITREQRKLYLYDPIHPTQAGYLQWWTPKFEACLTNVFENVK